MAARKKYTEKRMPFLEHLEELRWHIFRIVISLFVMTVGFYFISAELIDFFTRPYPGQLTTLGPTDPFMIRLKMAFFMALIFSIPVIVREFWAFVAPGLMESERKYIPMIIVLTFVCFLIGASFAFFIVLPFAINFLLGFVTDKMVAMTTINNYLGFVTQFLLAFGLVFELPMISMLLTRIGIITPELMKKYQSYAIVSIFVVAALITPPDAVTQIAMAVPIVGLFYLSIYLSRLVQRKRIRKEEEEEREYEEELKRERERKKSEEADAAGQEEIKNWETEGDYYEEPKPSPTETDSTDSYDSYPYDMDPTQDDNYGYPYSTESDLEKIPDKKEEEEEPESPASEESRDSAKDKGKKEDTSSQELPDKPEKSDNEQSDPNTADNNGESEEGTSDSQDESNEENKKE